MDQVTKANKESRHHAKWINEPTRVQLPISEVHDLPRKSRTQSPHTQLAPGTPRRRLRKQPQITNRISFK